MMTSGQQPRQDLTLGTQQDKVQLLRLWYHENCRVFRDRLVNEEDRGWFDGLLETKMEDLGVAFNKVCPFQPILYGDFMSPGSDVKSYELITSENKVSWCSTLSPGIQGTPSVVPRESEGLHKISVRPQALSHHH